MLFRAPRRRALTLERPQRADRDLLRQVDDARLLLRAPHDQLGSRCATSRSPCDSELTPSSLAVMACMAAVTVRPSLRRRSGLSTPLVLLTDALARPELRRARCLSCTAWTVRGVRLVVVLVASLARRPRRSLRLRQLTDTSLIRRGFFPAMLYHLSFWYTPKEMSTRVLFLYVANSSVRPPPLRPPSLLPERLTLSLFLQSGGCTFGLLTRRSDCCHVPRTRTDPPSRPVSGLFAYAVSFADSSARLYGWQVLFILEGLVTILLGVGMWFLLPNFPQVRTSPVHNDLLEKGSLTPLSPARRPSSGSRHSSKTIS